MTLIHPDVVKQLDTIKLVRTHPLLICDADEVLFDFMSAFTKHLEDTGYYYDWKTLSLTGNIRCREDQSALSSGEVRNLIDNFFLLHTADIPSVAGAAAALRRLNEAGVQIVVLSNLPIPQAKARQLALARAGMAYPLVANIGLKGPPVRHLASKIEGPTAFVDDIPHHHDSVAQHARDVHRLHFSVNPRLRALQGRASNAQYHPSSWKSLEDHLTTLLGPQTTSSRART